MQTLIRLLISSGSSLFAKVPIMGLKSEVQIVKRVNISTHYYQSEQLSLALTFSLPSTSKNQYLSAKHVSRTLKHPSISSNKHQNIFWYIVSSEINQSIAAEGLNASYMSSPWTCFRYFKFPRNLMTLQTCLQNPFLYRKLRIPPYTILLCPLNILKYRTKSWVPYNRLK